MTRACWYDPEINPSYLELARHYGTAILPTRIAKPRDKAAAEVGVQVVERWVLRPLPTSRYEFARWKRAKLGIDYHVEFEGHFYSAPYRLARQEVEVRATNQVVEIYHKGARVASHVREYGKRRFVTDPEHMPASHRAHLEWTPSRLVRWGAEAGPAVAELAEAMMRTRPHPEHGYRACLGLMQLEKRYGKERLNAACQRALLVGSPSYRSVQSILKVGLDRVSAAAPKLVVLAAGEHENLRGPAYYRQEA